VEGNSILSTKEKPSREGSEEKIGDGRGEKGHFLHAAASPP